jgi:acetyl-CoA carboxylase carboxyl transferase subunit alpha
VPEPEGGAHQNPPLAAELLRTVLLEELKNLSSVKADTLLRQRIRKFSAMGSFTE